ncbi:MAG TPA: multidrug effflux MFS transporter [Geminicoccaceae bacterium]|nr:multidrug effflux MFS transporter [Geminicoccaceae bacterium]
MPIAMETPQTGDEASTAGANGAGPRYGEFVALVALMTSLVALSIDAMLPALATIGAELGARHANDAQLVLSALFLGLAFAQMIYGPLSDSVGRKPAIYLGFGLFIGGCLLSALATSFPVMLVGRLLQGIGAAGPRIVIVAMVRDRHEGRAMARIMSSVMAVFILVPALAPGIGQLILLVASWRAIFGMFLAVAAIALVWFAIRQPETLPAAHRASFSPRRIASAAREVCVHPVALGYTVAAGLIFGALVGYLTSAAQIFQGQYGLGARFPLYFGALALAVGVAAWCNSRLVMRYGMRLLSGIAVVGFSALSVGFFAIALATGGQPALWALMVYFGAAFFCLGILFGNFNALAMEPLGHIAGVAASVIGSLTTFTSMLLGTLIGRSYDGTVLPLVGSFAILGIAAMAVMRWAERGR